MEREKTVKLEVFLCDLHIIVTEEANESVDKRDLRIYTGDAPGVDLMKECDGFVINKQLSDYYVFLPPNVALCTIVHESVHLTGRVFGDRGAVADYNNDEVYAYYVGWIAGIIADEVAEACKSFACEDGYDAGGWSLRRS